MHGGAWGSGAPDGNSNALKHGYFTSEAIEERQLVRTVLQEAEDLLRKLLARSDTICSPDEAKPDAVRREQIPSSAINKC